MHDVGVEKIWVEKMPQYDLLYPESTLPPPPKRTDGKTYWSCAKDQ